MSKRNNITYVKPQEPSFLAKLKAEIGYKEGPSVDTKRQRLEDEDPEGSDSGEERPEREDEQPQVVVLQAGDLSAAEALEEKRLAAKELAEKRADLSQPIVFKQRVKQPNVEEEADKTKPKKSKKSDKGSKKSKAAAVSSSKLSFNEDEEDSEGGED
ncbi:GL22461 [Drosophila persimilis]|uniref:Uncharacterized protein KIAA1143 homolog n=2 Tax=pseudoobscura subgroup TaxID=32358 RepID=B5DP63_DROPS|nr:uncharacterized protein KIAA1143 homolog [Drosophila persimilis]XP_002134688.1 uncharacterized protein KIAA1143 homolog [Drosophila pseudoobscura]XP_017136763.1 uncharacterized protein KIAA1143 homolog [Drosophila miranda]EDW30175.1 GL22461 [Drosophila persimilis]